MRRMARRWSQVENREASAATEPRRTWCTSGSGRLQLGECDPLAEPVPGHHQAVRPEGIHRRDHHERAAGDRVRAVGGEPRHGAQRGAIAGGEPRGELADLAALQDVAVDPRDRVRDRSHVDLGEVPHRPPGADHAAVVGKGRDARVAERLDHVVAEIGDLGRSRRVAAQELVGGDQRPQLEGPPAERAPAFEVGELEAPAADVDEVTGVDGETVDGPEKRVSGFLLAVDDLDRQARCRPRAWRARCRGWSRCASPRSRRRPSARHLPQRRPRGNRAPRRPPR